MTTPDLEDVLATTLHRRAEDAMIHTDTRREHEAFAQRVVEETTTHRRRLAVGGSLVAAAAVAATAVWVTDTGPDRPDAGPVEPTIEQTEAEQLAQDFFAAYAAGDAARVASYADLNDSAWRELRHRMRAIPAWHLEYLVQPCQELSASPTDTYVYCEFDYHVFGSEELGLGPFGNNTLSLRISGDKVLFADFTVNSQTNGDHDLYQSIGAWVRANHPGEWEFLDDAEGPEPEERRRWYRLWEQRVDEYLAERLRADG